MLMHNSAATLAAAAASATAASQCRPRPPPTPGAAPAPASRLAPLNWASVASWFFRPDACATAATTTSAIPAPTTTTSTTTNNNNNNNNNSASGGPVAPSVCTAIRCTVASCSCECFTPGKMNIRYCDTCGHSWVPHALDKLGARPPAPPLSVEPVQANAAFDIASLVLYGCQALPIRLKILLDRLFSVLRRDEVLHVLAGFGWTHEDYARGYILQETHGTALERWHICSAEEEPLVLRQFLRFGETRAIALQLLAAAAASASAASAPPPPPPPPQRRPPGRPRRPSPPSRPPLTPPHPAGAPPLHRFNFLKLPPPPPPQLHPPPPVVSSSSSNGQMPRSPPGANSVSVSPLNRLQSMQPFDFRKLGSPPEAAGGRRRLPDAVSPPAAVPASAPPPGLVGLGALALHPAACGGLSALPPLPPPPPPPPPLPPPAQAAADSKSPAAADVLSSGGGSSEFGSGTDDDDDSSHSALNLSRDGLYRRPLAPPPPPPPSLPPGLQHGLPPLTQLPPGAAPRRGLPGRRHWGGDHHLPLNLGTQLINPATGKKRVQCNVCLKTFCDKGALKIHFSAVHLREMHKCTVDGCNMMFSSRRSRNRHSANPNPKLHSPHLRRKISPHDGRSAHAHGPGLLVAPPHAPPPHPPHGALPLGPVFSPFPMLGPAAHLPKHSIDLSMHRFEDSTRHDFGGSRLGSTEGTGLRLSDHLPLPDDLSDDGYDDDDDGIVVDGGPDDDDDTDERESTDVEPQNLTQGHEDLPPDGDGLSGDEQPQATEAKRPRLSESGDVGAEEEPTASNQGDASNEDSQGAADGQGAREAGASKNPRTRKNRNPTRFALPAQADSNHVSCDEDSSAESPFEAAPPTTDNVAPDEEPSRASEAACSTSDADRPVEATDRAESGGAVENAPEDRSAENGPVDCPNQDCTVDSANGEMDVRNVEEKGSLEQYCYSEKDQTVQDSQDIEREGENTAKEDDKGGQVECIKAEREEEREEQEEEDCHSSDESMSSTALQRLESLSQGPFGGPELNFSGCPSSPARSQGSSSNDSPGEDAHYFYPETGSFIGPMDVPIDKDNPRRCTACGKVFQNHFGVKTHFQNVHLKLMHKCTVEGCNAAFPSKRSRDRHSANLNLHRKLLSTSADSPGGSSPSAAAVAAASFFMDKSSPLAASLAANPSLHGEFLARLYAESHALPLGLEAAFKGLPPPPPPQQLVEHLLLNGERLGPPPQTPPQQQMVLPPLGFPGFSGHLLAAAADAGEGGARGSSMSSSPPSGWSLEDDPPAADCDGRYPCAFCGQPLADASALKDHYECRHAMELSRCATCGKLFTSGERLRQHADAAHGTAGPAGAARLAACS